MSCSTCRLLAQRDNWYPAGLVYWRHCFPFGCPFLGDRTSGDNHCHVCPFPIRHFNRSTLDHSTALIVIPTRGSAEWAVQPLQRRFAPVSPMCWVGFRSLGWWWLFIVSGPYNSLSLKWQHGLSLVFPQTAPTDDAQKSSVSWSSTHVPMDVLEEQKRRTNQRALVGYRLKTLRRLRQWQKNLQELKSARIRENSCTLRRVRFMVYIVVESWPESLDTGNFLVERRVPRYLGSPFHI